MKLHPKSCLIAIALICCLGLIFSSTAHAQILLNGGFEEPHSTAVQSNGGEFWTGTSGASIIPNNLSVATTPYGSQYLQLLSGAGDSQVILTGFVAGQTYVLGADFTDLNGLASQLTLAVSGAANVSQTFNGVVQDPDNSPGTTLNFQSGVLIFTASSTGSATITLSNSGASSLAVDNVALFGNVVTVPEPSTWALTLAGLGFVAAWRFRRSIS
jgi:PEP-CTERM motif